MGASEVLETWRGWFTVSASRTTSCRLRASSKIRSTSPWIWAVNGKIDSRKREKREFWFLTSHLHLVGFTRASSQATQWHYCVTGFFMCWPGKLGQIFLFILLICAQQVYVDWIRWWQESDKTLCIIKEDIIHTCSIWVREHWEGQKEKTQVIQV